MTVCAYCQMAAENVDPAFPPADYALDGDETCTECDLPALAERALVLAERSLEWKGRWERDEIDGQSRAESIAETIKAAWGSPA